MTLSRLLHHMMDAESPHAKEEKLRASPAFFFLFQHRSSDSWEELPTFRPSLEPLPFCFEETRSPGVSCKGQTEKKRCLPSARNWLNAISNTSLVN